MYIFPPEGQTRGIKQKEATTVQRIPLCRGLGLALSLSLAVSFTISAYSAGGERASSAPIAQNLTLSTYKNLSVSGQFAEFVTSDGIRISPLYDIHHERYVVYWKK